MTVALADAKRFSDVQAEVPICFRAAGPYILVRPSDGQPSSHVEGNWTDVQASWHSRKVRVLRSSKPLPGDDTGPLRLEAAASMRNRPLSCIALCHLAVTPFSLPSVTSIPARCMCTLHLHFISDLGRDSCRLK